MATVALIKRNLKLFFKDKGLFFSAMITPMILLVLYATFLSNVYHDSFTSSLPHSITAPRKLIDGTVACQLVASLLSVSCITTSFCANLIMIQDKANGALCDLTVTPVKSSSLAIGYYVASALSSLIISFTALVVGLVYIAFSGWYLTIIDVVLLCADVIMLTLLGTALSSCVNFFLSTNGQASAVSAIISAGYGFICGAYMPIATFSTALRNVLAFLPGTHASSLIKAHALRGVFDEMAAEGYPSMVIDGIKKGIDADIEFFGITVSSFAKYAIIIGSVILFTGLFVLFNVLKKRRK